MSHLIKSLLLIAALAASSVWAAPIDKEDSILVVGATGRTGVLLVEQLQARGMNVVAGVRNVEKAKRLLGEDTPIVQLDLLDQASLDNAVKGKAALINAASAEARKSGEELTKKIEQGGNELLVEAAVKAGLKKFVLISSMGVTQPDHFLNRIANNVLLYKFEGEKAIKASGIDYTIIRPGGLKDGASPGKVITFMQGDPKEGTGFIHRADVATISIEALLTDTASKKTFEIVQSKVAGPNDFVAQFSKLKAD